MKRRPPDRFENRLPAIKIRGYVKWFNDAKGFGFISANNGDYFAHYSDIVGEGHKKLERFQAVLFVPSQNTKGLRALEIVPLEKKSALDK